MFAYAGESAGLPLNAVEKAGLWKIFGSVENSLKTFVEHVEKLC